MITPTVTVISDALQVTIDVDRSRIFAPDGSTIAGAGDKFDEIEQANEELLQQARAARTLANDGRKRAVVLDAWVRQDLPEAIRFTRKAYIALANPDECEIGEAAIKNFGLRTGVAEPPSLSDLKEALLAARLFEASGPIWIRRA